MSAKIQRDKEVTKQKLLDAVGILIISKNFLLPGVNEIAKTAGVDKKLIYNYFGSRDGLIDEYIQSQDFWGNASAADFDNAITDGGKEFAKSMLLGQFDYVFENKVFQKILLWGLLERRDPLIRLANQREENGELLLQNISDPYFGKNAPEFRAAMALLISGVYYLDMFAGINGNTFCGVDMTIPEGREKVKGALVKIINLLYSADF